MSRSSTYWRTYGLSIRAVTFQSNVTNIVLHLVFPNVGKINAGAIKQGAVIPLQQAIEPPNDAPLQPLQNLVGGWSLKRGGG